MHRRSAFMAAVVALLTVVLQVQAAQASPLVGFLFQEVNDVHLSKQGEQTIVAIKGRAWMWNHHITFRIIDASGRQCLNNFLDMLSLGRTKQLQFGGYYSGQTVDQPNSTTKTEFSVITECYFR